MSGRAITLAIWIAGLAALIGLTLWFGAGEVGAAIVSVGWASAAVLMLRVLSVAIAGGAWWLLFAPAARPGLWLCVGVRCIREGANALLPLAQVGGDVIGARCLALRGTPGATAAATVIVDVVLQAVSQMIFAIVGLLLLVEIGGHQSIVWPIAIGLPLAVLGLAGFLLLQGDLGRRLVTRALSFFAGDRSWQVFGAVDELFARLNEVYARRGALLRSLVIHLVGWFVGALEVWVVLWAMGHPIGFGEAVIIESLMHAVRGAAFAVPGALGAQEGGLIMLCAIFGIGPEAALALSLVKRLPDLVIGVPGLVAWQAMEGWRYRRVARTGDQIGRS